MLVIPPASSTKHQRIHRYPSVAEVSTQLDPLEDALLWIKGLRSTAYCADLLAEVHGISGAKSAEASDAVSSFAKVAGDFLDQAFSGPGDLSYLPVYYAMLNLSKAMIVAKGMLHELDVQRRHGASWSGIDAAPSDLLDDEISLWSTGAIPLLYQVLTAHIVPVFGATPAPKRPLLLKDVYPYILPIGHEFGEAYGRPSGLAPVIVYVDQTDPSMPRLIVQFHHEHVPSLEDRPRFKLIESFQDEEGVFVMRAPEGMTGSDATDFLVTTLPRFLLYDSAGLFETPVTSGRFHGVQRGLFVNTNTPGSSSDLLLPEELPILLAFFHLSNVVRYAPLRLQALLDSRASAMLQSLSRHGTYRFLLLFWSFMNQRTFLINP